MTQDTDTKRPPSKGGCWFCKSGNGFDEDSDMAFDIEFDTYYHEECLDRTGAKSVLEYEGSVSVRFADGYVEDIAEGEKTSTLRLGFPDWVEEDEKMIFIDSDSDRFATATVAGLEEITAEEVVNRDFEGHRNYPDVNFLIGQMSVFYPDADIDKDTTFTYLTWENLRQQ